MSRPRNHAAHLKGAVNGLAAALTGLVTALGNRSTAAPVAVRAGTVDAAARTLGQRGPGRGNPKLKSALNRSWANYTPVQRKARVAKMLKGRRLKPKSAAKRATPRKAVKPKAGGAWASMTPEQRAERMAKMRAGRAKAGK